MASNLLAPWEDVGGVVVWARAEGIKAVPRASVANTAKANVLRANVGHAETPDTATRLDMKGSFAK